MPVRPLALAAVLALALAAPGARAADPLSGLSASDRAYLDGRVPAHPLLTGYAGLGFGVTAYGDGTYGLAGAMRVDSNAVENLWFDGKFRFMPGDWQGDASVGLVLGNSRAFGYRTWSEKVGEDARYDYFRVHGKEAFIREASVLSVGAKLYKVTPKDGTGQNQTALSLAYQSHDYSHHGDRNDWDVALLWNPSGGFGAVMDVNYGLPIGYPRFTVGGQIGILPIDSSKVTSPTRTIDRVLTIALEFGWNFGS